MIGFGELGWPENVKAQTHKTYDEVTFFYDQIIFSFTANILHLNTEL